MKTSHYFSQTLREVPAEAEIKSHQLMLRAGMIKQLASGLYSWLPLGVRVLKKVEAIVRKHLDKTGAQELLMPMVQPAELWRESGRWDQYGLELLRFQDRHQRDCCLGPTHEEVITDIIRGQVTSHKQLPINLYQIQTKFRDEVRPRSGIMRSREFIMKDAYSFHIDQQSLEQTYADMYQAYYNIFTEIGFDFCVVIADSGNIGGAHSHEFHVLAEAGEDTLALSDQSNGSSTYAANVEMAEALAPEPDEQELQPLSEVSTPDKSSIESVAEHLHIPLAKTVKTLVVGTHSGMVALVVRGDHRLSNIKAERVIGSPLTFADSDQVKKHCGCLPGFIGPIGIDIPIVVDRSAAALNSFVCGANKEGFHYRGANWQRDLHSFTVKDIREVNAGDPCPDGSGKLRLQRGIEVGHIFQLGDKYSAALNLFVLDDKGQKKVLPMGCYGIGITRIVAAAIEQGHDDKGIIWSEAIAPFQLAIIPVNLNKSTLVATATTELYQQMLDQGVEVLLFDQPNARLGQLLTDAELYGLPHRVIIGERGLKADQIAYQHRSSGQTTEVSKDQLVDFLLKRIKH